MPVPVPNQNPFRLYTAGCTVEPVVDGTQAHMGAGHR